MLFTERLISFFREFLNGLRLEEFLELARSQSGRTYLEPALEVGLASASTFLRAFRTRYATTPAEYLSSYQRLL